MRRHEKASTAGFVLRLIGLLALTSAAFAFTATSASALVAYAHRGVIAGPAPGLHFSDLTSESVAVNNKNGHIYVADSTHGLIYDFSSASDTEPALWTGESTPFGSFGKARVALAVDNESGDVYVADTADRVIDKFDQNGNLIESFGDTKNGADESEPNGQLAGLKSPAGSFEPPITPEGTKVGTFGIAVDQATHDLYAIDAGHQAIDVFDPSGAYLSQIVPPSGVGFAQNYADGIAVDDAHGRVYVSDSSADRVYVFENSGGFLETLDGTSTEAGSFGGGSGFISVAANESSGDFYVSDTVHGVLDRFDATSAYLDRINEALGSNFGGIAVDQAGGDLYVSDNATHTVNIYSPTPVVLPDVETEAASELSPEAATLNGTVNPASAGEASCRFRWGTSEDFGNVAPCSETVAEGNTPVAVHAEISGLQPGVTYFFRLEAENANGSNPGEASQDREFTATGPRIDSESVSAVSAEAATLEATIDPNNAPTTYFFQYGTDTSYGNTAPLPPGTPIGSGEGAVEAFAHLQGLSAATAYHYRVIARSELAPGQLRDFAGPDRTFTTQGLAPFALPDSRQWELVSPPDKRGASLYPIGVDIVQAAANGSRIAYSVSAPTEVGPAGNALHSHVLSARGLAGWSSRDIATPHSGATGSVLTEYRAFSNDLSLAVVQPAPRGFLPLSPATSEQTLYLRTDFPGSEFCAADCYRPLVTGCPPEPQPCPPAIAAAANVPPGTKFAAPNFSPLEGLQFRGATPDMSHLVFDEFVNVNLAPGDGGAGGLYSWSGGVLTFIGGDGIFNSISADGSHVVFEEPGTKALYLRDTGNGEILKLDEVTNGSGKGPARPVFQYATPDGSKVFFTDTQRLTADSGAADNEPDLYECEIEEAESDELTCDLTDLTPLGPGEEHAHVMGLVLGASADGSYLYFVANGVLAHNSVDNGAGLEAAQPGECQPEFSRPDTTCNLYLSHEGATSFLATLSGADVPDWYNGLSALPHHTARVSGAGRRLAFMSRRNLVGYDNRDAVSGKPDEEVYLYHAGGEGKEGKLACASCNPSGARPHGVNYHQIESGQGGLAGGDRVWEPTDWIAANIPGWTPYEESWATYQSRYLSDSGRLFFNSSDSLLPQDSNGTEDVYEYEPPGLGGCTQASPGFSSSSGGCLGLISSGTSKEESVFLDASESGDDVFFLSSGRLSGQDVDTAIDLYDAHSCSTESPCLPEPPPPPPACAGDACQRPATTPEFPTPTSALFSGQGNSHESKHRRKKHRKPHHRKGKQQRRAHNNRGGNR